MTYSRRLLRPHIDAYRRALAEAKAELSVMNFQAECRAADLARQLDEVRCDFEALKLAVRNRIAAERQVVELRQLRDATRDFGQRLN